MSLPQVPEYGLEDLQPGFLAGGGRFTLERLRSSDAFSADWLAWDDQDREKVVLKFFHSEISSNPLALAEIGLEAQKSRKLSHPNIVRVKGFVHAPSELAFAIMDAVEGKSLKELQTGRADRVFTWPDLKPLIDQICAALAYAHAERLVYRRLTPANLVLDPRGRLLLADFGLPWPPRETVRAIAGTDLPLPALPYFSPQVLADEPFSPADDCYALGATMYDLLSGKPPFWTGDIAHQIRERRPAALSERLLEEGIQNEIPAEIASMVLTCLAKHSAERPAATAILELLRWGRSNTDLPVQPAPYHEPVSLVPPAPERPVRAGEWHKNAMAEAEEFERSLPQRQAEEEAFPSEPGSSDRRPLGMVSAVAGGLLLLALGYFWGTRDSRNQQDNEARPSSNPAPAIVSVEQNAGSTASLPAPHRRFSQIILPAGQGPAFTYRYEPRQARSLDTNAINFGVRFLRESPPLYCSFVIASGTTNNSVGTITYDIRPDPGYMIQDLRLSQRATFFNAGRVRGVYSVDGGNTFKDFFLTPPFLGKDFSHHTVTNLSSLNTTNVVVRYILQRYQGVDYHVQFIRDCEDNPSALEISGSVVPLPQIPPSN